MQNLRQKILLSTGLLTSLCFLSSSGLAAVPVVDLNQSGSSQQTEAFDKSSLSTEQRLELLEKQVSNLTQMNLQGKIDDLEQQIQQFNGQLEVQTHTIQTLTEQQKSFYQDLDQRLGTLKNTLDKPGSKSAANNVAVIPPDAASNGQPSNPNEEKAYKAAFDLLVSKQYDKTVPAFKKFLMDYPAGKYAGNAHYWLGETYSTLNKNELAGAEFNTLITKYADNPKKPDAMLKLAIIHDQAGQHTQSKQELQKIIKQFPGSSAAQLAKMRLQQMKTQA